MCKTLWAEAPAQRCCLQCTGALAERGEGGGAALGCREGLWEKIPQLSQYSPAAVPRLGSRALWFAEERELTWGWSRHLGPK